jgi:hypothetical protein
MLGRRQPVAVRNSFRVESSHLGETFYHAEKLIALLS